MSDQKDPVVTAEKKAATAESTAPEEGEKGLSNKELKELKKLKKQQERAQKKEKAGIPNQAEEKAVANKQKKAQQQEKAAAKESVKKAEQKKKDKRVAIFSHLETKEHRNNLSLQQSQSLAQVHPAILSLTLKYSSYTIVGSTPRCKAMLQAFQRVVAEYQTPEGTTLSRNLTSYLGTQIDHLKTARPLSMIMGNAIRWLKQQISAISIDTPDAEAKATLVEEIDNFIREKIDLSGRVIIEHAVKHIQNGSTVLTFGNSNVLRELFLHAHCELGRRFTVIIVDSRPLFEGKKLAETLTASGLKVQYVLITALTSVFQDVDTVFLGAHAMLSNGFLYSRVGTALIAMKAKNANIPVLVCCESLKFSERVQLDSVTFNELGDSDDLTYWNQNTEMKKTGTALRKFIETHTADPTPQQNNKKGGKQPSPPPQQESTLGKDDLPLKNWKESDYLNILNIMYDLTPPDYIQKVVTEVGALPPSSVPVILREYTKNDQK